MTRRERFVDRWLRRLEILSSLAAATAFAYLAAFQTTTGGLVLVIVASATFAGSAIMSIVRTIVRPPDSLDRPVEGHPK